MKKRLSSINLPSVLGCGGGGINLELTEEEKMKIKFTEDLIEEIYRVEAELVIYEKEGTVNSKYFVNLCDLLKTKYKRYFDRNSKFHELINDNFKKMDKIGFGFVLNYESIEIQKKRAVKKRIIKNKEYIDNIRSYLSSILKVLE
jgi:hypothetical protein